MIFGAATKSDVDERHAADQIIGRLLEMQTAFSDFAVHFIDWGPPRSAMHCNSQLRGYKKVDDRREFLGKLNSCFSKGLLSARRNLLLGKISRPG